MSALSCTVVDLSEIVQDGLVLSFQQVVHILANLFNIYLDLFQIKNQLLC